MKKSLLISLVLVMLLALTACGGEKKEKDTSNKTEVDLYKHLGVSKEEGYLVLDNIVCESKAMLKDGTWYIPDNIVCQIDSRFYVNKKEEQMIYTDAVGRSVYYPQNKNCVVYGEDKTLEYNPILIAEDGRYYIALDLIKEKSPVSIVEKDEPKRIVFSTRLERVSCYKAAKGDVKVRIDASDKYEILTTLNAGDVVFPYSDGLGDWMSIITEDGLIGYVNYNDIEGGSYDVRAYNEAALEMEGKYTHKVVGSGKVLAVWHSLGHAADGSLVRSELNGSEGVNLLIPTWYTVSDVEGNISSFANKDYVDTAHNMGMKVFGLINDFAPDVKGIDVYSNSAARKNIVDSLIASAAEYGLDGINVDFEYITNESAPHYLQLLRELYLKTREAGLVLSVCVPAPYEGNSYYNLAMQSKIMDYVMVMAYDEHYNADNIGSVASKTYVAESVVRCLENVPEERLVLGVPFYTRAWVENGDGTYNMRVLKMKTSLQEVANFGANVVWDEESGQNIATYKGSDGKTVKVWLEDEKSLQVKKSIAENNELIGVACWALGQQSDFVWNVLK